MLSFHNALLPNREGTVMFKKLLNLVYNDKEKRLRGSFVTSFTMFYTYGIYSLIAFLIYYSVYIKGEQLSDLTALISAYIISVAGGHTYNTSSYFNNKTKDRANRYARSNKSEPNREPEQEP